MKHYKNTPGTQENSGKVQQQHFPCGQCGADLEYSPGMRNLGCEYCGHENPIIDKPVAIKEYNFSSALEALARAERHPIDSTQVIKCPNCAAAFELKTDQHAGDCPFCDTPVVVSTEHVRLFQPKSLLPFIITEQDARNAFDSWISNLWFAPSALKDKHKRDEKLLGIYVPYWTYDSHTDSIYHGKRGTVYYERRMVTQTVNGRARRRAVNVPRIRWTPASGRVRQFFDDILVGATRALPRRILDSIQPWDLQNLVSYNEAYLSGFQSEIYQVDLDEGFQQARMLMDQTIRQAVRRDIGGDQQQINSLNTHYSDTTFKHVLLPVWSAAFRYQDKTYRFVINGRTGRTQGERPYSKIKIGLLAITIVAGLAGMAYYLETSGALEQMMYQFDTGSYNYYYR
uniref:Primosomal protein N' (Replication factor Y) -superfamily II helicase n=1 Tax=uncultured Thiotrichaceae bacterium TaxID=298394 RepID=A0A6S6TEQ3_9GAMM|nr:MAG: Primosomal protein N' (replication factor Y) -superfamily II helicase [uncultured Thiotrichaceae bacterium]